MKSMLINVIILIAALAAGVGSFAERPTGRSLNLQEKIAFRGLVADSLECALCKLRDGGCGTGGGGLEGGCDEADQWVYNENQTIASRKYIPTCDGSKSYSPEFSNSSRVSSYEKDKVCWVKMNTCWPQEDGTYAWTVDHQGRTGECGKFDECKSNSVDDENYRKNCDKSKPTE